jgi:allantoate deiminase
VTSAADIIRRCRALANHSEEPGTTLRTFLSEPMRAVHRDIREWMAGAGMEVNVDAAGNIRGVYEAIAPGAPRFYIGSHLDTVPSAGAFDGILGVVMGVALVERRDGRRLPFSIEVLGFSEEEGVRFRTPFIGSRAFVGTLDDEMLSRVDGRGTTVGEAIQQFGLDSSRVPEARFTEPSLGYLEFHIEQGPVLDRLGLSLGIVNAIAGQTRAEISFSGTTGHAGTTPMNARADAVACAADWVLAVEHEGRSTPGLVATVGKIDVRPGAANVVAGHCTASLDVRHVDDEVRLTSIERLQSQTYSISSARGLDVRWHTQLDQPSVAMSTALVSALTQAVERTGTPMLLMPSGAGHDAMVIAEHMPAAMLFLRSPGGISHHPDETVREEDVEAALQAGGHLLTQLAEQVVG